MGTFFSLSKSATSVGLNISEIALLLFGVLLTLGLIGEYSEADRWKKYVKVFEMFVIIGVAGELLADGGIFLCSSHLQTISDLEVGSLNVRATQAEATAKGFERQIADANARAKGAEAQVASANAASRDAVAKVSTAEARIAEATARAAEANKKAEAERLERLKLEAIVAPRSLTLDQQREIADACRKFKGHAVLVNSYGTDGEGSALAGQIISALRAAGIIVADSRASTMVAGEFDSGVHVRAPIAEVGFAYTISSALSTIGKLDVSPVNDPVPRAGAIMGGGGQSFTNPNAVFVTVTVGIKPVPTLATK